MVRDKVEGYPIALPFDRRLGRSTIEAPVKLHNN